MTRQGCLPATRRSVVLLAVGLSVSFCVCDYGYDIEGTVTACATGAPILGARVVQLWPGQTIESDVLTDAQGRYYISELGDLPEPVTLRVVKPTWRTAERRVPKREAGRVDFCLEPEP